ncbi:CBO0543 family protein [Metabacillus litoralis]|uniref:CBO0543 family protein n=1 Tax=Metabacillus litoralis TaxID=152268 RepID=UPI00203CE738|nr:CBO0543 family protein [Metabacillus litoralis]
MIFNILIGLVLPWTVAIFHLYKKERTIIPLIGSFFSVIAFIVNEFGFYCGFWRIAPFFDQKTLSALPFNLGMYPILASYLIYFIKKTKKPYLMTFFISIFTTFLELTLVLSEKVIYSNGWNIIWTFFSYLIPYIWLYWYYLYLKKLQVMS